MRLSKITAALVAALVGIGTFLALGGVAYADQPRPWEMGFQAPVTPVMQRIENFHDFVQVIIVAIAALVLALLVIVIVRFNARANPTPSRTTHNTVIEVAWTVVPILILLVIAVPSFKLLYFEDKAQNPDMTIKVTGHQWYWSYQYPGKGNMQFDSIVVQDSDLKPGQPRLLTVDNPLVVPVNATVRVLLTGADVIHDWSVPAFGIKLDAVPGRLNETWFKAERTGTYYGQCDQLCGQGHGFMPIEVKVVSKADYDTWVQSAQKQFGAAVDRPSADKVAAK
ncbi:MAG TPA: cytochrome c oxidase subunit II [Alphaproteobacteria bacterium]|nr:cytochrome c oxidase subunit II [Alphaproteobacteria bacterium]